MTKLIWDSAGTRIYETGIDRGVFYESSGVATPWNGLSEVVENTSTVNETVSYIDGNKYLNQISTSEFSATLKAYTYPDVVSKYTGEEDYGYSGQVFKFFNLSYRTLIGNDIEATEKGYKIHLIYNAIAKPLSYTYESYGAEITPTEFSWEITTTPIKLDNLRASSHFIIDSTKVGKDVLLALEDRLYGTDIYEPSFPAIDELFNIFEINSLFIITDHGDGSFTASSSEDEYVSLSEPTIFNLNSPSVILMGDETYKASTL